MTGSLTAGDLLVRIGADTSRFAAELKQKAEAAAAAVFADVRIGADTLALTREVRQAAEQVTRAVDLDLDVNPDVAGLTGEVRRAAARVNADLPVDVVPDPTGLLGDVNQVTRAIERQADPIDVPVKAGRQRGADGKFIAEGATTGTKAGKAQGAAMAGALGGMLTKMAGPLAAIGGAAAGVSLVKSSVEAASNLGETQSKVNQIFGKEGAAALNTYAATASTTLGQTKQQALDASATFGIFGKSAGLQGKELAGFSSNLTSLATDMASFGNTDVATAINAIGGALRGETEPIRQFGVMLDADTVAAQALEMGLVKTNVNLDKVAKANANVQKAQQDAAAAAKKYGADSDEAAAASEYLGFKQVELAKALKGVPEKLTPQAKIMATQALVLKQTGDQQGDFARTSGGLANQQRILAAQWGDMKTQLGSALLPAVTAVITKFNEWLPKIAAFGGQVKTFLKPVTDAIAGMFGGLDGGPGGGVGEKIAAIGAAFSGLWATLQPILASIRDALTKAWETIGPEVTKAFGYVQSYITTVLGIIAEVIKKVTGVIRIVWEKWGNGITNFVTMAFGKIVGIISGVLQAAAGVVRTILAVLKGDWKGAWEGLVEIAKGVWKAIYNAVSGGIRAVGGIVDGLWALFKTAGVNIVKGLWAGIGSVAGWLGRKFSEFFAGLPGIVKRIFGIESPSKVMAGFGVNMVQGMVVGMDRQRPELLRALTRLVPDEPLPIPTLAASGASAPAQGAATGALAVPQNLLAQVAGGPQVVTVEQNVELHNHYPAPERPSESLAMSMRRARYGLAALPLPALGG